MYNIESCCFVMMLSNVSVISNGVSNVSIFYTVVELCYMANGGDNPLPLLFSYQQYTV